MSSKSSKLIRDSAEKGKTSARKSSLSAKAESNAAASSVRNDASNKSAGTGNSSGLSRHLHMDKPLDRDPWSPARPLRPEEHAKKAEADNTKQNREKQIRAARCVSYLLDLKDDDPIWELMSQWGPVSDHDSYVKYFNFSDQIALINLQDQRKILSEWESLVLKNYHECAANMETLYSTMRYVEREMNHEDQLEELVKSFREQQPNRGNIPKNSSMVGFRSLGLPASIVIQSDHFLSDDALNFFGHLHVKQSGTSLENIGSDSTSSEKPKRVSAAEMSVIGVDGKPLHRVDPKTGTLSGSEVSSIEEIHQELTTRYRILTYATMAQCKLQKCIEIFSEIVEFNIRRMHEWRATHSKREDYSILLHSLDDMNAMRQKTIRKLQEACHQIKDPKSDMDRYGTGPSSKSVKDPRLESLKAIKSSKE